MEKTTFKYASNWRKTCKLTLDLMPRCAWNPLHKALVVHHLKYKRSLFRRFLGCFLLHNPLQYTVSGYEIIGWDIVSVCSSCHDNNYGRSLNPRSVHHTKVWIQKGGLNNHNTFSASWKLRCFFWLIVALLVPFRILFICCHRLMRLLRIGKKVR